MIIHYVLKAKEIMDKMINIHEIYIYIWNIYNGVLHLLSIGCISEWERNFRMDKVYTFTKNKLLILILKSLMNLIIYKLYIN